MFRHILLAMTVIAIHATTVHSQDKKPDYKAAKELATKLEAEVTKTLLPALTETDDILQLEKYAKEAPLLRLLRTEERMRVIGLQEQKQLGTTKMKETAKSFYAGIRTFQDILKELEEALAITAVQGNQPLALRWLMIQHRLDILEILEAEKKKP